MSLPEWRVRPATKKDRKLLATFSCADPGAAWELEVEEFVQEDLIDWAFAPRAQVNDPRLLLIFERKSKSLVGIAAHEAEPLQNKDGTQIPSTKLVIVAVAAAWQGKQLKSGDRASDVVMAAAMKDVADRVPGRNARVFALIHERNVKSIALCRRHGLVHELARPADPAYRRFVTEHRQRA